MRSLVAVTAAALLLAGCSGGSDHQAGGAATQAAQVEASSGVQQPDEPSPAQRTALLKALTGVDPALTRDRQAALDAATKTCADLLNPKRKSGRVLREAARLRFSGGTVELDQAQTMKVLTAVRSTICQSAAWP